MQKFGNRKIIYNYTDLMAFFRRTATKPIWHTPRNYRPFYPLLDGLHIITNRELSHQKIMSDVEIEARFPLHQCDEYLTEIGFIVKRGHATHKGKPFNK